MTTKFIKYKIIIILLVICIYKTIGFHCHSLVDTGNVFCFCSRSFICVYIITPEKQIVKMVQQTEALIITYQIPLNKITER